MRRDHHGYLLPALANPGRLEKIVNHPNRGRPSAASNPAPDAIKEARAAAGLTQTAAAHLIGGTMRAWQEYEAGNRRLHPGLWELFLLKSK